jgi:putative oxidoreductase
MANYAHPQHLSAATVNVDAGAWALLAARVCFAADFMLFGARKFADPSIIYKLIEQHHLPGELVDPTIVLQLGCGFMVLVGFQTRLAAAALGWFCIVAPSIFWSNHLEHLSRDYAAAGGFMLLVLFGAGPLSLDARLRGMRDLVVAYVPSVLTSEWLISRVMLIARVLIAFPFLGDVVKKCIFFAPQRAMFEAAGLSGEAMYLFMAIELICGIAVLIGHRTRLAAIVLMALVVFTALVFHNPKYDFGFFGGDFASVVSKNFFNRGAATFFKDVTTLGALLTLAACGPGRLSRDGGRA